jgi:UDP:flavonoid glycosyltransferase YjiC (YdhE family)
MRYRAGVPHVVLAQWYDTYDYACRTEYLGIGVYGNRSVAPFVNSAEFGQALTTVVGNQSESASAMKERARLLGEVCKRSGGRGLASDMITKLAY